MKIVLSSCGVIEPEFKEKFFALFSKPAAELKMLYITTAADGEDGDKSWIDREFATILDLGIREENITEYKIGEPVVLTDYDLIYMLGGNAFYLMDKIRECGFDADLKRALDAGVVYVGSSAGSVVLGETTITAAVFGDEAGPNQNFDGLGLVRGAILVHFAKREEAYREWMETYDGETHILYDGSGEIITD